MSNPIFTDAELDAIDDNTETEVSAADVDDDDYDDDDKYYDDEDFEDEDDDEDYLDDGIVHYFGDGFVG